MKIAIAGRGWKEKLPRYLFSRAKNDDSLQREGYRRLSHLYLDDDYTPRNLYHRCNVTIHKNKRERFSIPTCWTYRETRIWILMRLVRLKIFYLARIFTDIYLDRRRSIIIDILSVTFPTCTLLKIGGKKTCRDRSVVNGIWTNGTVVSKVWRDKERIDRE